MKVAIVGRTEILFKSIEFLLENGYEIPLIITSKEAPEYTKISKDFESLAKKIGAKYLSTFQLNSVESSAFIKDCGDVDIAISFNYPSIISQEIINLFPLGILNAHGGDLPKYRGNACQAWAIINGEDKIGLCIHSMIGGELDSGNIIEREYLNINSNTKVTECWQWMEKRIPFMFLNSVQKLQENSEYFLEEQSKDCKDVLRCYPRVLSDGKINWIKSNIEILRLINASNKPYSGAYCFYKNEKMIIWDAEIYEDNEIYLSEPRQVLMINKDGSIIIATGNGKLKINEVECNGHIMKPKDKVMTIRDRLE
jgi:UDP-4-amino-4-deoxy-L-arabinose formyltransferase/UDP-glucuronic acid dehydrogenase (UDP-4-keto-hexauronic acid decarboxylating)